MGKKEIYAKVIRVISAPPILAAAFLIVLSLTTDNVFDRSVETGISVFLLGILPVLAYPLQHFMPHYKNKGRKGQRKLAFIFSLVGYVLAMLFGFLFHVNENLLLIYLAYFISIILLTVLNRALHVRASGHMCSIVTPMMLSGYLISWKAMILCVLLIALVGWSSITLKRHTLREIIFGACAGIVGSGIAILLI